MPWPSAKHTLDCRSPDRRSAAYFDAGWGTAYGRMEGFRRSAHVLYKQMINDPSDRDLLVYPFASNWRHGIELQLKHLLELLGRLHHETFDDRLKHTHNLVKLWTAALPSIKEILSIEAAASDLSTVTKLVGQLTALDPDGQELRYHKRTDGKPSLENYAFIDVPTFHESLRGVAAFLDGLTECVNRELEFEREMAYEYPR